MPNNEKSMKNLLLIAGTSASMVLLSACGDAIDDNDMDSSKTQPVVDQNGEEIEQPVDEEGSGDSGGNSGFFFMWLGGLGGSSDSGITNNKTTTTGNAPKKDESKTDKVENRKTDSKNGKSGDTKSTKPKPVRGGGFGSGATNRGGGGG